LTTGFPPVKFFEDYSVNPFSGFWSICFLFEKPYGRSPVKIRGLKMRRITKAIVWIGVGGALYLVSCHHFIYLEGGKVKLLKKKEPTFSRTFFSTSLKSNEMIIRDEVLREAGIADLLIKVGRMSAEEKERILKKLEWERRKKQ
jgi:hypothetical protein